MLKTSDPKESFMTKYISFSSLPWACDVKECNITGLKLASQASAKAPELKGIITRSYIGDRIHE